MADFSHIEKKKVSATATAEFELYGIDMEGARLTVAPATRINKPFTNAQLAMALPQRRRLQAGRVDAEMLYRFREDSRGLYADHVLKGWSKVVDAKGKEVPYSKEDAHAFLEALPDQTFDELVEFCENEANFGVKVDAAPDAAKN